MIRATVFYMAPTEDPMVIFKGAWGADNGQETCVFPTQEEAVSFAMRRWRVTREQIRIDSKENAR